MKYICILIVATIAAGCTTSSQVTVTPDVSVVSKSGTEVELSAIVNRKARKYGINPNLLRAVVNAELSRSGHTQIDTDGAEWISEQVAKVMKHILRKTSSVALAADYYASGNFRISQELSRDERILSSAIVKDFKKRQKLNEWKGWE